MHESLDLKGHITRIFCWREGAEVVPDCPHGNAGRLPERLWDLLQNTKTK